MKGILLAGGLGSRLYPITKIINKHLLPVYNKPMIYYSLSTLMFAGIKEILLITSTDAVPFFKKLLNDGSQWNISIQYAIQDNPNGIAECFLIGEKFLKNDSCLLALGDNILYRDGLRKFLKNATLSNQGCTLFSQYVQHPNRYGVIEFDQQNNVISIEEKPKIPKSNQAIIGLYCYNEQVVSFSKNLKKSKRGELEITDINNLYLKENNIQIKQCGRGTIWFDVGVYDDLLAASSFIQFIENRQGLKIGDPSEIYRLIS